MGSRVARGLVVAGVLLLQGLSACGSEEPGGEDPDGPKEPQCISNDDCEDGSRCLGDECVASTTCTGDACEEECVEGAATCVDEPTSISVCNDPKSGPEVIPCPEQSSCTEPSRNEAECVPWLCMPGSTSCDGNQVEICDASGLSRTAVTDCEEGGGLCEDGACVEVVCDADALFCDGAVLNRCNESGTSFVPVEVCAAARLCDETEGACVEEVVCEPGTKTCEGTVRRVCNVEGTAFETVSDCYDTFQGCQDGECVPEVCTPGAPVCYDEYATRCDAQGTGVEPGGTDCLEEENTTCWDGECLPIICVPLPRSEYVCIDGASHRCRNNGTSSFVQECSGWSYCNETTGRCNRRCTPGAKRCIDGYPLVCNADGFEELGDPCTGDELCVSGECKPLVCPARQRYCDGQSVYQCGGNGTSTELIDACDEIEFCGRPAPGQQVECLPDICTPGTPTCNGELVSGCRADGSGPQAGGTECPEGEICVDGACAEPASSGAD